MKKIWIVLILMMQTGCNAEHYYYQNSQKKVLIPESSSNQKNNKIDYFRNEKGVFLGVTDQLLVKCKSEGCLEHYKSEFNLTIVKELSKALYLVKVADMSLTIDTANKLSEKYDVNYAHPDFVKKYVPR